MTSKPDRRSSHVSPPGVKWVRWRGTSRGNQRSPARAACRLARFGTPTSRPPPGTSHEAIEQEERARPQERLEHHVRFARVRFFGTERENFLDGGGIRDRDEPARNER